MHLLFVLGFAFSQPGFDFLDTSALEAPRFSKHTFQGCDVYLEGRFSQAVRTDLAAKGHKIELKGTFSSVVGGGQAVMRDFAAGVNYGASDPRKDGQAVAELPFE